MKRKLTFYGIKILIFLLINVPMILITTVVSTVLGITAGTWIDAPGAVRAFTAVTSLFGFLGLIVYTAVSVRKMKRAEPGDVPWRFALKETVAPALYLAAYAAAELLAPITVFEGAAGYLFAPYLWPTALGLFPVFSAVLECLIYWLTVFLVRLSVDRDR